MAYRAQLLAAAGSEASKRAGVLLERLVRHDAKAESPLIQLVSNGVVISTLAEVTFYGTDQVGNQVSVTATIQIDFGNFGDS